MSGANAPAPGTVLAGKYRVERALGQGGMGIVLAVHDELLDRPTAIKLLAPSQVTNERSVERFVREARAAAKLQSEHVTRIYEVGQLEHGMPYIAMELLMGADLASVLAKEGALPIDVAVDYLLQAIDAVAEAHALGIVHRDLKPSNLFLAQRSDQTSTVKVLDFGIAKTVGRAEAGELKLTSTSAVLGSPAYMSPEQIKTPQGVDARTDIWALGVTLYELVSTRSPFDADTASQLLARIIEHEIIPLRSVRPDAPPELEAIVMRCMSHRPEGRYAHVGELARALAPFGSGKQQRSIDRAQMLLAKAGETPSPGRTSGAENASAPTVAGPGPSTPHPGGQTGAWGSTSAGDDGKRRRVAMIGGALGVLVAGMLALGLAFFQRTSTVSTAQEAPAATEAASQPPIAPAPVSPAPASASAPAVSSAAPPATAPQPSPAPSPHRRPKKPRDRPEDPLHLNDRH
jgi:serine/threonine-protein kinase